MCVTPAGKIGNCTCGMPKLLPHSGKKRQPSSPSFTRAKPSHLSSSSCLSAGRRGSGVLKLQKLQSEGLLDLADTVVAVKDETGKAKLHRAGDLMADASVFHGFGG